MMEMRVRFRSGRVFPRRADTGILARTHSGEWAVGRVDTDGRVAVLADGGCKRCDKEEFEMVVDFWGVIEEGSAW